jgi:hypothetical protein
VPRALIFALLASAACTAPEAKSFDISALQPTVEADQKALSGWFVLGEGFREFRLYPSKRDLGKTGSGECVSGMMLSLAGVPTPDFNGLRMAVTGSIHRAGSAEVGATRDACGAGIILLASDVSVAQ